MKRKLYLPYYRIVTSAGRAFYGEVHLSLVTDWYRRLILAQPGDPGFTRFPLDGARLEPLAQPGEYRDLLEEALARASQYYEKPIFEVRGLRDIIKIILTRKAEVKDRESMEARLLASFARDVLGLLPGEDLRVEPEVYWLGVDVEEARGALAFWLPGGGRFRVLERFAAEDERVRRAIVEALSSKSL